MSPTMRQHDARFPARPVPSAGRRLVAWLAFWLIAYLASMAMRNTLLDDLLPVGQPGNGLDLVIGPACLPSKDRTK